VNKLEIKRIYIGMMFLAASFLFSSQNAWAQDDWQLWNGYGLKIKINDDFSWKVYGEHRIVDDFSESRLGNVSAGFLWHPSKYFEIGPFFKYERSRKSSTFHINERRWLLEGTLKARLGPLKISDRNRVAYRGRNTTDIWRYRNRLKISYPIAVKKITISPFVSEEVFFESKAAVFSQNRVKMGMSAKITKNLSLSLYYMIKSNRRGADWSDVQVLGTGISISV